MSERLPLRVRQLGLCDYQRSLEAMQHYTEQRTADSLDELWLLEHPSVFTQGLAGKAEHVLDAGTIPVVQVDRGGQVTYHGPGQLVMYCLLDLKRRGLHVRPLVSLLEQSVVELLSLYQIEAYPRPDAPGVYVQQAKIASLGLRVRRGCSYHGLSLNVNMDLAPFLRINPCGYAGLAMTQVRDRAPYCTMREISKQLLRIMLKRLEPSAVLYADALPSEQDCAHG